MERHAGDICCPVSVIYVQILDETQKRVTLLSPFVALPALEGIVLGEKGVSSAKDGSGVAGRLAARAGHQGLIGAIRKSANAPDR
jgi:hypothetical protein